MGHNSARALLQDRFVISRLIRKVCPCASAMHLADRHDRDTKFGGEHFGAALRSDVRRSDAANLFRRQLGSMVVLSQSLQASRVRVHGVRSTSRVFDVLRTIVEFGTIQVIDFVAGRTRAQEGCRYDSMGRVERLNAVLRQSNGVIPCVRDFTLENASREEPQTAASAQEHLRVASHSAQGTHRVQAFVANYVAPFFVIHQQLAYLPRAVVAIAV